MRTRGGLGNVKGLLRYNLKRGAAASVADELLAEREKNHLLQEEVETTLKDLQSM